MPRPSARRGVQMNRLLPILFATCLLALPAPAVAGTIVADSGFRPNPDGFSFPNYGDEEGFADLDRGEVQRLFGPGVCLAGKGARCVLTPPARSWMQSVNREMSGGHCYGFATLTELIHKGDLPRFGYSRLASFGAGAALPFALDIEGNRRLQRSIARAFVMQTLPAVNEKAVEGTPTEILDSLRGKALAPSSPESWTMTIFQRGFKNGHAITPYAVESMGGGVFDVHVYDNNWPGDDTRRLTIDTNDDTWNYYAAINPGVPAAEYEGDAKTETLSLMPVLPGLGLQPCPICVGRQGLKSSYNEVRLDGAGSDHAKLVLIDSRGRKSGYVGNRVVNRIPGVRMLPRTSGGPRPLANGGAEFRDSPVPVFRVPKKTRFKVRIFGSKRRSPDRETLAIVGPTYDATVENIVMGPGQVANVQLSPRARAIAYRSSRLTRTPAISLGAESKQAAYKVTVAALDAPRRSTMTLVKRPKHQLMRIGDTTTETRRYRLTINRFTAKGQDILTRAFEISGRQQAFLDYGPLARPDGVARVVVYSPDRNRTIRVLPIDER